MWRLAVASLAGTMNECLNIDSRWLQNRRLFQPHLRSRLNLRYVFAPHPPPPTAVLISAEENGGLILKLRQAVWTFPSKCGASDTLCCTFSTKQAYVHCLDIVLHNTLCFWWVSEINTLKKNPTVWPINPKMIQSGPKTNMRFLTSPKQYMV